MNGKGEGRSESINVEWVVSGYEVLQSSEYKMFCVNSSRVCFMSGWVQSSKKFIFNIDHGWEKERDGVQRVIV